MTKISKLLILILLVIFVSGCGKEVKLEVKLTEEQKKERCLRYSRVYRERCMVYYLEEINKKMDKLIKEKEDENRGFNI